MSSVEQRHMHDSHLALSADAAPPTRLPAYRPELDALRFFAFFSVFIHHVLPRDAAAYSALGDRALVRIALAIENMFGYGLTLFFMLSAFLITDLLLREKARTGKVHIGQFYIRRILRIWPLYFLGIALGVAYALLYGTQADQKMFLMYAVMIGNWYFVTGGWTPNPEIPLWSISIEEQFYLVWPSVIKWLAPPGIRIVCAAFIGVAIIVEFVLGEHHVWVDTTVWTNTFVAFETFAVGALLALALRGSTFKLPLALRGGLAALGLWLWFASVFWFSAKAPTPAPSGLALVVGTAMSITGNLALVTAALGARLSPTNFLVYLGKISFGLYVFHLLWIRISAALATKLSTMLHFHVSHILMGALSIIPTIACAALSYRYFETFFLRLKQRFTFVTSRPI